MILSETYTLKDSLTIPKFGLGTWLIDDKSTAEAVRKAIGLGYRLIDTAQAYGNERGVGEGVRTASVPREDIFITSKIAAELKDYESASKSIDETLNKMGLDYIDMMLIHSPQPWKEVNQSENRCLLAKREVWKALKDAYDEGKVKAIGVANFLEEDLMNILENCRIRPMVDQLLYHVGNTPFGVIDFCKKENILVEAYSPIAHGAALKLKDIEPMAKKYGATIAQLCIRYDLQLGTVVLPKTANPDHMKANADVDFTISDEDMEIVKKITFKDYGEASHSPVFGGKIK